MKLQQHMGQITRFPSKTLQLEPATHYKITSSFASTDGPLIANLQAKITETIKRKLSFGAKIFWAGGLEKIFEHHFSIKEGEKLLKVSQCYISTTTGPILGRLFISTHKVAFCSEKPMKISSKNRDFARIYYKVVIPVGKISRVHESRNMKRPSQKYMEVVTVDNYDFWFLGFLSYRKTFQYLQQAIF